MTSLNRLRMRELGPTSQASSDSARSGRSGSPFVAEGAGGEHLALIHDVRSAPPARSKGASLMSSQPLLTSRRRALMLLGAGSAPCCSPRAAPPPRPSAQRPRPRLPPATRAPPASRAAAAPTTAAAAPPKPTAASRGRRRTAASASGTPKMGGTLRAIQAGDLASIDGHYYTTGNGLSAWIVYDTLTALRRQPQAPADARRKLGPEHRRHADQAEPAQGRAVPLRSRAHQRRRQVQPATASWTPSSTAGIITGLVPPETIWTHPTSTPSSSRPKQPLAGGLRLLRGPEHPRQGHRPKVRTPRPRPSAPGRSRSTSGSRATTSRFGKNQNYWQSGKPYLDGITLALAKDQQAMVAQFEAGALDFMRNPPLRDYRAIDSRRRSTRAWSCRIRPRSGCCSRTRRGRPWTTSACARRSTTPSTASA